MTNEQAIVALQALERSAAAASLALLDAVGRPARARASVLEKNGWLLDTEGLRRNLERRLLHPFAPDSCPGVLDDPDASPPVRRQAPSSPATLPHASGGSQ